MTVNGWLQILVFLAVLVGLMRPLGLYMARVFEGERTFLDPLLKPVERFFYRLCGVNATQEMNWREYTGAMLLFSFVSLLLTYVIERAQHFLPWNPQGLAGVTPALAWNTAALFTTNTNWQSYVPETTMSYFTQMVGLSYHNFLSAAVAGGLQRQPEHGLTLRRHIVAARVGIIQHLRIGRFIQRQRVDDVGA